MLPFIYADLRMVPAESAWLGNARFRFDKRLFCSNGTELPSTANALDGRVPDIFMVSSMHLHSTRCDELIQGANRIDAAVRPLVIVGGPRIIYSPWEVFSADPDHPWGADVAVTGEEYVLLRLLEVLLSLRGINESMRSTFLRARDSGALDEIPGLVYGLATARDGAPEELVDTGVQRLLGDLEMPPAHLGYSLLEPPGTKVTLEQHALAATCRAPAPFRPLC
jgi:hypothetical protein